jgi:hypothetical protein
MENAKSQGYGCLGGQFQFRMLDGTYEMYWLSADSSERKSEETWSGYSQRSCSEVLDKFNALVSKTDFTKEASSWKLTSSAVEYLVFVAYFETEASLAKLADLRQK